MRSAPENLAFQKFQLQFTGHIRNPKKNPRPSGVPARRMAVYNELLFNNIEDVLSGCFPVLKQILGKRKWKILVRGFFAEHSCRRPFFRQVPDEFLDYLEKERKPHKEDPPFLKDLAHYEWVELDLFVSDAEIDETRIDPRGDLLKERPAFAPALRLLAYPFEVHRIGPKDRPDSPSGETFHYLVFRNNKDEVEFVVLNPVTARLVSLLIHDPLTGREAIEKITQELEYPHPQTVLQGGHQILRELREKSAILGTWKK
jgi:uncharacterized protein